MQVQWTKDDTGRYVMNKVPGSEKTFKADLILLAMGFLGPEYKLIEDMGLQQDPRSNVETPLGKYKTSVDRVFAAGGRLLYNTTNCGCNTM